MIYALTGIVLLLTGILLAKAIYGEYLTPVTIVFAVFYMHAYVDPLLRRDVSLGFNTNSWSTLTAYSSLCFAALIGGLLVNAAFSGRLTAKARLRDIRGRLDFRSHYTVNSVKILCAVGLFFAFTLVLAVIVLGAGNVAKGGLEGSNKASLRFVSQFRYLVLLVPPFLYLAHISGQVRWRYSVIGCSAILLLIGTHSLLIFSRQSLLVTLLMFFIILNFRVRKFNVSRYWVVAGLVFLVAYYSLLRRAKVGILQLDGSQIVQLVADGRISFFEGLRMLTKSVPGQEVFSNVIPYFDFNRFWYGISYVDSFFGRLLPLDLLGWQGVQSPVLWYRDTFLNEGAYGRDFSMMAESYMNFGYLGAIVFLLLGVGIAALARAVYVTRNPTYLLWAVLMLVNVCVSFRNDSGPFVARMLFPIVPFLFLSVSQRVFRR